MKMAQSMFQSAAPEFVAVVLASTRGARLFPLTSIECPKHLLPVGGTAVLSRLLQSIEASGFLECVVVIAQEDAASIPFLKQSYKVAGIKPNLALDSNTMKISVLHMVEDCQGSAEALRQVEEAGLIAKSSHAVVIPGDLIVLDTDVLRILVDAHRYGYSSREIPAACTVLLADVGEQDEHGIPLKESAKQKKGGVARDEEEIEYIGLSFSSPETTLPPRLIWKQSKIDVEEDEDNTGSTPKLVIPKPRLRQGIIRVRTDWSDQHVYILAPWVRKLVSSRKSLFSIQGDLLPLLISRQFQGVSATFGKNAEKDVVEEVLVSYLGDRYKEDQIDETTGQSETRNYGAMDRSHLRMTTEYAVLAQIQNEAIRAHTVASYLHVCRDIVTRSIDSSGSNPCLKLPEGADIRAKFHSVILKETTAGDKVTFKSSFVGRNCRLGSKCRLNNVVVMDNVTIGDNCILQNSVVGAGCKIGDNCNLNDCQVEAGNVIPSGTKEKGESLLLIET